MTEPAFLCRYRSLSGTGAEWVRDSILHSKHYFANPLSFNDPFDCRPYFALTGTRAQQLKYFERVVGHNMPELGREARRTEARRRASDPAYDLRLPKNMAEFKQMYHETVTSRLGILCLSEVRDNILMWAHYADAHRGCCLVFDSAEPFFATAQPVRYKNSRPSVNPLVNTDEEMLDNAMYTKSDHWNYEKEWRILQYKKGAGVYKVPTTALKQVILGAQISEPHKTQIREWICQSSANIILSKATLSPTSFALKIVDL